MTEHKLEHEKGHGHSHAGIDPSIASSDRGIWAVKWSFAGLFVTAALQLAVVIWSNSISLLADTIHNFAGVREVKEVRARWLGHQLLAEVNIAVDPSLTVEQGHEIATGVHRQLMAHLPFLARAVVHVDPVGASGEEHHTQAKHRENGELRRRG